MIEMSYGGIKTNVSGELNCALTAIRSLKAVSKVNFTVVVLEHSVFTACGKGDLPV